MIFSVRNLRKTSLQHTEIVTDIIADFLQRVYFTHIEHSQILRNVSHYFFLLTVLEVKIHNGELVGFLLHQFENSGRNHLNSGISIFLKRLYSQIFYRFCVAGFDVDPSVEAHHIVKKQVAIRIPITYYQAGESFFVFQIMCVLIF